MCEASDPPYTGGHKSSLRCNLRQHLAVCRRKARAARRLVLHRSASGERPGAKAANPRLPCLARRSMNRWAVASHFYLMSHRHGGGDPRLRAGLPCSVLNWDVTASSCTCYTVTGAMCSAQNYGRASCIGPCRWRSPCRSSAAGDQGGIRPCLLQTKLQQAQAATCLTSAGSARPSVQCSGGAVYVAG